MKFFDDTRIPVSPYPELQSVLAAFVEEVTAELKANLAGIYLVGSLALGDFDPDSDVDFLVVTETVLSEANRRSLREIHTRLHGLDGYPAKHLEGSYISIADLNDPGSVGKKELFYFDNGSTTPEMSTHDNHWHVRWILRERGITLAGRNPQSLLPPIPARELSAEVRASLLRIMSLFEEAIDRPLCFFNSRFGQSFTVLTCCRMLHTLATGTVPSKKAGAHWARRQVEREWIPLIDQAWEERKGVRYGEKIRQRAQPAVLAQTLEFIRYTVDAGQAAPAAT